MNFGEALTALKEGKKVSRSVWGGYWILHDDARLSGHTGTQWGTDISPYFQRIIIAVLRDNKGFAPAQPYQEDILAEDWQVIE